MEGEEHHKTDEIGKTAPAGAGRMPPDDVTEINPAEFFDPEEFGIGACRRARERGTDILKP
jgi:hypothetical protein